MLRSIDALNRCKVEATDGSIGSVTDTYFDDDGWGIRYLVVDTGGWLGGRDVLISPMSVREVDFGSRAIRLSLTRESVEASPPIDTHRPVSRQHERDFLGYYGYPTYWGGPLLWGLAPYPYVPPAPEAVPRSGEQREIEAATERQREEDAHLRSVREIVGYAIAASDGRIGDVDDLLFDDEAWAVRYFVVDTSSWWQPGSDVLVGTRWIEAIDWPQRDVRVRLTREQVRSSPPYDPSKATREYEQRLHEHYGVTPYW